ncbi:response regulator transcription factor [Synechococcus sp. PCC 6312]|uniref:response regulator transcription factor n=1 Tax=Synechococcus sp. (strain ATCC 27167 / PCC 6312) TaxID=195253 RepID=UPI00029F14DE|nr:response regulator transcription factor [Synechococcus sp. PCC 6312]AFY61806.1 response regulator containing a CheY-like receiver domain and an HTH DNA-binding domain [Synechococcus sp. PCC 6312]
MVSAPIRILLVEDDELFRLGLSTRLQQEVNFQVMAQAEDGETALDFLRTNVVDVVILDVGLPGLGGLETCYQIKQNYPKLPVLILTSHSSSNLITDLIKKQAQGYCLKGGASEHLVLAIQSVVAGASWWDTQATENIQSTYEMLPKTLETNADLPLTKREKEILSLIATGKSNIEIGQELYIAPGTVRVHVHAILHKLGMRDRTQAAIWAMQQGLDIPSDRN